MAAIRIILKTDKTNAKGEHPVALRLADSNNKRAHFYTGFYSTDKYFDTSKDGGRFFQGRGIKQFSVERKEEGGVTQTYTNKEANEILSDYEGRANDILKRYQPNRELFLSYANSVIETEYKEQGRFKKAEIASDAVKSFERYDKDLKKKTFQEITSSYIQGYAKSCTDLGNSNNTIGIRLREIRRIFNLAIRDKIIPPDLYPFSTGREDGKARIPKIEQNKTDQYLPKESMKVMATGKEGLSPILERTRHLFLFSYYSRGMNWKDMALLTKDNVYKATVTDTSTKESKQVTMMQYKRSKTRGEFDIQVTPNIQKELDWFRKNTHLYKDYVLPIIRVDSKPEKLDVYLMTIRKRFNKSLQELAKELELPESQRKITIYSARHSFAMTLQNSDKSVEIISQALGHQSVETTKHYLAKFSTTKMAEETDINLFDD